MITNEDFGGIGPEFAKAFFIAPHALLDRSAASAIEVRFIKPAVPGRAPNAHLPHPRYGEMEEKGGQKVGR